MLKSWKTLCAGLLLPGMLMLAGGANAADIQERTVKFSFLNAKEHPQGLGAQKFAELLSQKSGGKINVRLFPGGTLGGDLQTLSAAQGGTVEMTVMNAGILVSLIKEFGVLDLPFLFDSAAEADAVLDGEIGRQLLEKLPEKGLVGLGFWDLGFRQLTNSRKPVTKVEDIAGLKVRVIQTPIYIDLFKELGANPVPMAFTELYTALETGSVDGQENPAATIEGSKIYEVQKHLTVTRHIYNPQLLFISKKFWDRLSADEKALFQDAAKEATAYQREVSRQKDSVAMANLKAAGLQIVEQAPEEVAKMRAKAKPVFDKYAAEYGAPLVQQMVQEIEKARAAKK
ncbi:TRAP transporter substrate-binding protein [Azospirillum sp. SYSU D00513]|uniref:TRAP transporter substrate-binding protein n=1 Tax=Azospirillum sp. SYSU D00513 TaxID=2812561 RepID=UPI001A95A72D|nr:TRAP transporter substrate-binding protein [Azospirillum sp. SYSU D00513]